MPHPWLFLRHPPLPPAENMAWDEALLGSMTRLGRPVLRFYGWAGPAATFGYFQRIDDVERMTALRPLLRRPTGGGLVPHDADWTYSVVLPPNDPWYSLRAIESYRRMHEWIRTAFAEIKVTTELSPRTRKEAPGQCFAGAEQLDVLLDGRKLAGAAQRRTRDGLLIQGSIQLEVEPERRAPARHVDRKQIRAELELGAPQVGMSRGSFESAMLAVATRIDGVTWAELKPDAVLIGRARELAQLKYTRAEFNRRR